ncbi:thioredoxin-like protein [Schizophyllum amplum]|uniref:Thioredoxin-like protein n=1 Tax=Schizophyllum amplum TaxID=97359 RepID=A0A550C8L3_9AGAR|nr:thioredoxin-like protein [Auriculariopsis ampla]
MNALIGRPAPVLNLSRQDGSSYRLHPGQTGRRAVVFFFAKAGAMNCVYEVTHFREAIREDPLFQNIDIVGVSEDAVPKLGMLSNGHELTYPLLSDPQRVAHRAYRVQRGLFRWWVSRVTYVIDERGIVRAGLDDWAWDKHVPFVAQELQKLDREQQQAAAASASNGTGPASSPQISSSPGGGSAPPQEAGAVLPINGHAVVV